MKKVGELIFENCLGKKTLLYGEINTNKTFLTSKFVEFLIYSKNIPPKDVSILDFGPKMRIVNNVKIGGRLEDYSNSIHRCNYINLQEEIIPPRLEAKNRYEFYSNICQNYKNTNESVLKFKESPTNFLILNDISLYLHCGKPKNLLKILNISYTFFGNIYYGSSINSKYSKLFNILEKKKTESLLKNLGPCFFTG